MTGLSIARTTDAAIDDIQASLPMTNRKGGFSI